MQRNLIVTGWASFLTDVSTEMMYPLLQAFVAMILAGQRSLLGPVLGIIEGVSESAASLLKVFSGFYSDRFRSRKASTIAGFLFSLAPAAPFIFGAITSITTAAILTRIRPSTARTPTQ